MKTPTRVVSPFRDRFEVLLIAVLFLVGGCSDAATAAKSGQSSLDLSALTPFPGILADPTASPPAGSGAVSEPEVGYVSVPPGAVPNATSATIENYRTKQSISTLMVNGGFDPRAIGARAADTVLVTFTFIGGTSQRTWVLVPRTRRPAVVRVDPQSDTRVVQLDASLLIVFSEPIDPGSVSASTIALRETEKTIAGVVEVLPQQPWIARFRPSAELTADAEYELVVTDQVRDLDGEAVESAVRFNFTTAPPIVPLIAFSNWTGSGWFIYTMRPDGSARTVITSGMDPSFSPDGKRIAFWRYNTYGRSDGVYIANADGTNATRVADGGYQPTWSPDGTRLAFGCGGICVINIDGTGRTRLTPPAPTSQTGEDCVRDTDPTWSPNGSTIAFTRWPDVRIPTSMCLALGISIGFPFDFWTEVWFTEADGSNLRPLLDPEGGVATYAGWPSWSPDGKRLAFYHSNGNEERIDVASTETSGFVTVARQSPPQWDWALGAPEWSPDGSRILFGTREGWGFADASGSGNATLVSAPGGVVPFSTTWSWARR